MNTHRTPLKAARLTSSTLAILALGLLAASSLAGRSSALSPHLAPSALVTNSTASTNTNKGGFKPLVPKISVIPGEPPAHEETAASEVATSTQSPEVGGAVTPVQSAAPAISETAPFRFFSSTSFWNKPLAANAPIDPNSASVVTAFDNEIKAVEQAGDGPWINTTAYSIPIYTVPKSQPTVPVELQHKMPEPALSAAWSAVPLPADAKPAAGTDGILVVSQPSTNRLWEFWRLVHGINGWHASWGGAMQSVSSGAGVFGPGVWPESKEWWGASASSLSLVGGLISIEDLKLGQINHALAVGIPNARAGVYASPAHRSDGKSTSANSLPEGAQLRLNPTLDLATLHLPRLTLMIAEAAQRYGIFITDTAAAPTFYAQDPTTTGNDAYIGSAGYFEGKRPNQLLESFPWDRLELVKAELHDVK